MILSAKVVKHPQKSRVCDMCGFSLPKDKPQLKLYGYADEGEKPWNLHTHIDCVDHTESKKIEQAIEQYKNDIR